MNARTNNNVENAHIQNMYYRDLFYDHGDTEPVKPKIPSYIEEMGFDNREYLLSIIEENKRAVSDKVKISLEKENNLCKRNFRENSLK